MSQQLAAVRLMKANDQAAWQANKSHSKMDFGPVSAKRRHAMLRQAVESHMSVHLLIVHHAISLHVRALRRILQHLRVLWQVKVV